MPGGLLNLVAVGDLNIILNGNPSKTFFKSTYAKYTNFGLQRFQIPYKELNRLRLNEDSLFRFEIPNYGDLLMDTFFAIQLPDIYSPLYTLPRPYYIDAGGDQVYNDLSLNPYCQPYEFKWIDNLGAQLIRRVRYLLDGRVIQEFTGQYIYSMAERDLTIDKRELFDSMIGHSSDLNDPANYSTRNGNYPNVTYNNVTQNEWRDGLEPSIRGKKIYVPINIWSTLSSYLAFPITSLQYNKLQVEIECRPISELFVVRDMDYFTQWVYDMSGLTFMPSDMSHLYRYYDCPYIRPDFNDQRYQMYYFLQGPPPWQKCIGDFSYNIAEFSTTQEALESIRDQWYTKVEGTWEMSIELVATFAFLEREEIRIFTGRPQSYLIKRVYEQITRTVAGTQRINVNAIGMTSSWMWFFQRSDVSLRNEWSNYTNWAYKHMPFPCILAVDLSFAESIPFAPYITPCIPTCYGQYSICNMCLTGPVHPENMKEIMEEWSLYCDDQLRETSHPAGVFNYIEKYIRTPGNAKPGLYCYNFCLDTNPNVLQPSGGMNMSRFSNIAFEFSTILPFHRPVDASDSIPVVCNKNGDNLILGFNNPTWEDYNYNFDIHIMEERYNVLVFSNGMANYMFAHN
jgi:hypothetical protein